MYSPMVIFVIQNLCFSGLYWESVLFSNTTRLIHGTLSGRFVLHVLERSEARYLTKAEELLEDTIGKRVLLLANEAIARGVLEAGVRLVALYPGTPSSEIGNKLTFMAPHIPNFYFEFSANEKVALEVAGAAAVTGVRSMMVCKGPGLNVAADPFFSLAYTGVRAGMVIVVADDPSMWSSQNENDSRYYALMGNMPMVEPADPAPRPRHSDRARSDRAALRAPSSADRTGW